MDILLFNALAYTFIAISSRLFFKGNLIFTWIWSFWAFSAYTTIFLVNGMGFDVSKLDYLAFLYILCNLFFITWPLLFLKKDRIDYRSLISKNAKLIFLEKWPIVLFVILLLPTIENLILSFSIRTSDLESLYNRAESGVDIYHRLSFYSRNANRILDLIFYIAPFLLFRELSKKRINSRNIGCILVVMLDILLTAYNTASRTEFVKLFFCFASYYLFFRYQIPSRRKKKLKMYALPIVVIFVVALSFITLSRYSAMSNEQGALTWVSLYSGEGFYRFADLMWYKNDVVMLGDDNFPLIRYMMGLKTYTNQAERMSYWEPLLGVPNNIFYTFIGNFVSDFGFVTTTFLSIIIGLIVHKLVVSMKKKVYYYQVLVFSMIAVMLFFGIMHFVYKVWQDQFRLLGLIAFTIYVYFIEKKNSSRVDKLYYYIRMKNVQKQQIL